MVGVSLAFPVALVRAQTVPTGFSVVTMARDLAFPVAFGFLPGGRLLFAEQNTGRVRKMQSDGSVQTTPVISVPGVVAGGERGLLGLAVDPRYPAFPYLYVFHDAAGPARIRISRFRLAGDLTGTGGDLLADPASRYDLVDDIPDNASNHNGGTLQFGLEGVLYASVGEDGVPCAAQDTVTLRGVIMRLRTDELPDGPGRAFRAQVTPSDNPFVASRDSNERLVAAFGLRNPFRFQIDTLTGTLVIADVGESLREELDLLFAPVVFANGNVRARPAVAIGAGLGADFGWPQLEGYEAGAHASECNPAPAVLTPPTFDYDRTQQNGAAVIAAGYSRPAPQGTANWPAAYDGDVFASDYYSGVLRRLERASDGTWGLAAMVPGQSDPVAWGTGFAGVSDWRVGPNGALWFCRQSDGVAAGTGAIGFIAGPGNPVPPAVRLALTPLGSPAIGGTVFRVEVDRSLSGSLTLYDSSGRVVRHWSHDEYQRAPDGLRVTWDGLDAEGRKLRPGLYLARLEAGGRVATVHVPLLR